MKKALTVACFLMISLATFAQIPSIGIKGGINYATMATNNDGSGNPLSSLKTFNAGIFADIKFGNISLQPALNYTGKGGNYSETLIYPVSNFPGPAIEGESYNEKVKEQLFYLQLPVNIVCHIPVLIGNIYFGAGPYIAEGLSGKISYSNGNTSDKIMFGNDVGDIKPQQFGVDAIAGFKLKGGLLINVNYDLGLSNDIPSSQGGSSKSHVFGISLGYVFL